jgi:hypothetical protein
VENPVGLVATDHTPHDQVLGAIQKLDPHDQPGKLTLIVRMRSPRSYLPPLLETLRGRRIVWCCDPSSPVNLHQFLRLLQEKGVVAGGVWATGRSAQTLDLLHYLSCVLGKTTRDTPRRDTWNRFSL